MARRQARKTLTDHTRPVIKNTNLDFDTAVELFQTHMLMKNLSERTRAWHAENLTALQKSLELHGQDDKPGLISEAVLRKHFILPMIRKGLKTNTINGRIRSARALFKYLYDEALVSRNPAQNLAKLKLEKPVIETFTKQQVKDFLGAINQNSFVGFRDYVMMLLFLETGMRVSEVASLRVGDILLEESIIRVVLGKGAKGRMVPFQNKLGALLKKYSIERGQLGHNHLFITRDELPLKKRTIQERFTIYGKKANLSGVRCSPHTMRHTMAKFYIMSGGDIFSLQKILGHSSLEMVRYYVELFGSEVKEQHRKYSPIKDIT